MYRPDPNKRRKSMLGRRFRNGEQPLPRITVCAPTFPVITPGSRLGRLLSGGKQKASQEYVVKKQLFHKSPQLLGHPSSSGKKCDAEIRTCAPSTSLDDSQNSQQSDNSLNLTGIQSIKEPTPDYRSGIYDYSRHVPSPPKTYNPRERPKSPGFSHYERYLRLERAKIKAPVDPDDLIKDLTLQDEETSDNHHVWPKTSTTMKGIAPPVDPDDLIKDLRLQEETSDKHYQVWPKTSTTMKGSAPPVDPDDLIKDLTLQDEETSDKHQVWPKTSTTMKGSAPPVEFTSTYVPRSYSGRELFSSENAEARTFEPLDLPASLDCSRDQSDYDSDRKKILSFEKRMKSVEADQSTGIFDDFTGCDGSTASGSLKCGNREQYKDRVPKISSQEDETRKHFPSNRNQFSQNQCSNNNVKDSLESKENVKAFNTDLDATIMPYNPNSAKKLSVINEKEEKDSIENDLNSTDSFLLTEQTIIQENTILESYHNKEVNEKNVNGMASVCDVEVDEDEWTQAIRKLDTIVGRIDRLHQEMSKNMCEMMVLKTEAANLKPVLQRLAMTKSRLQHKKNHDDNKENIAVTTAKQHLKNKWFNDLRSENPNLLKTPNPLRTRPSLANQTIMTPHSLSIVINDQINELFD